MSGITYMSMFESLPTSGLVLLLGTPGSGKTTFAQMAFAADSILSTDRWRAIVGGSSDCLEVTAAAHGLLAETAAQRLERGLLTIVDSTGTDATLRCRLEESARHHGVPVHYIHVSAPLAICLRRNSQRELGRVPEGELRRIAREVESVVAELQGAGRSVSLATSFVAPSLTGTRVFLALPVTEFMGQCGFRRDRRELCERIHAAFELAGATASSAALNEGYGTVRLSPVEYSRYDIEAILEADCVLACSTSTLSPDTYLEIGAAVGSRKPVGVVLPARSHRSGMLRGLIEAGSVMSATFELDAEIPRTLIELAKRLIQLERAEAAPQT
jgi:predicted kinase